ncbi:MAG TPA: prealbumin-like fold domain-containing protein [Bacteroidia bacterium]|nr:prealbumin-like fold domain-containing protein [Bacteroidia bacterium]
MKSLFVFILFIVGFSMFSQVRKSKIKIVQYMPYCGGAKPNKELQNTPNKGISYSNKKLIYISDKQRIDTLITDKNGYLKFTLPYGTYFLYEPWKYYMKIPKGYDEANINKECLKEEWAKEDMKITISKKTITVVDNLKLPKCPYQFPCLINKYLPQ